MENDGKTITVKYVSPNCKIRSVTYVAQESIDEISDAVAKKINELLTAEKRDKRIPLPIAELTLNSPITPEQWALLVDVDFDHTDRIWFRTEHDKDVVFVKERKGKWINHRNDEGHNIADCDQCGEAMQWFDDDIAPNYCSNCGSKMDRIHETIKQKCEFCKCHDQGDTLYESSDWDGGIGFDYIRDIKFCPLCGKMLK